MAGRRPPRPLILILLTAILTIPSLSIPHPQRSLEIRQSPFDDVGLLASGSSDTPPPLPPDPEPTNPPQTEREPSLIHPLLLIPRTSSPSLSGLQVPSCALACYIRTLTTDGCDSETDFKCHCTTGNILGKAANCVKKSCDEDDQKTAVSRMKGACREAGVDVGDGGGGSGGSGDGDDGDSSSTEGGSSSTAKGGSSTEGSDARTATDGTSGPREPTFTPPPSNSNPAANPSGNPTPAPAPGPSLSSGGPSASASSSSGSRTTEPPMPTDTPLALLPTSRQLSPGAKAGISVSVSVFASAILVSIALYIRRLKRELRLAQAAAGVPESVWRASIQTAAAPSGVGGRRRSWGGRGRSMSRRRSWHNSPSDLSPVSPLSPRFAESGDSVLRKKKARGNVLSVVVEREEEDTSSMDRIIHEPVPGQKEGLVDPLELDGEYTGIFEAPTSITPRARSMERSRERGASVGEGSRPSTGGLEKIDERRGL